MKRKFNSKMIGAMTLTMVLMSQMAACKGGKSGETPASENNSSSVTMVAEFFGLPVQKEYLSLSECEQFLLDSGLELADEK